MYKKRPKAKQMADGAEDGVTLDRPFGPGISKMSIRGNVVEEIKLSTPIATMQEYCKLKLNNKLRQLDPPRITGIVDWEFSGFFPPVDEFLDDWLDGGNWPKEFYIAYLKRLEENGVATPARSVRGDALQMAWWLEKTIENAAPWWILGENDEKQAKKILEKTEFVIQEMLENFDS